MARSERSAGFVLYRRPAAAGAEVEYLLLDYGRHFDYPKGHVEAGEDDLGAAVREREETGIADAAVADGFRHELVYYFRDRKKGLVQDGRSLPGRDAGGRGRAEPRARRLRLPALRGRC